jgi:small-conductance mechanosensitive channel
MDIWAGYILTTGAKIAGAFAVAGAVYLFFHLVLGKLGSIRITKKIRIETHFIKAPVAFMLPAIALYIVMPLLGISDKIQGGIFHILNIIVISCIGWLGVNFTNAVYDSMTGRYDMSVKDNLRARKVHTQMAVLKNVINIVIIIITAACVLITFPRIRQIGVSILASAGIMSIILGFAAQKTLGNLVAGVQIALTQPIRLDDVVIVENEWGWIEEITLTYVVVRIWDLRRMVVPISYFVENSFQNWTRKAANILGTVFLYTDYTVDVQKVREKLSELLEKSDRWDGKVNVLQVTNTTERSVEIRALMSAKDSPTAWELRCEIREKLLKYIQQEQAVALPRERVDLGRDKTEERDRAREITEKEKEQERAEA